MFMGLCAADRLFIDWNICSQWLFVGHNAVFYRPQCPYEPRDVFFHLQAPGEVDAVDMTDVFGHRRLAQVLQALAVVAVVPPPPDVHRRDVDDLAISA